MAADIYVRSTDGNNADNGSTWALAKATIAGATAIDAAGDTIWVSQVHAETSAAAQTLTIAGTRLAPVKIMCANDGAAPPTAGAITARLITTLNSSISITAASAYIYGISFEAGTTNTSAGIGLGSAGGRLVFESCNFQLGTIATNVITILAAANSYVQWRNCTVKFNNTGHTLSLNTSGMFHWVGGSFLSGTSSPAPGSAGLLASNNALPAFIIEDVDFSNLASTVHLCNSSALVGVFRNCKLPASWSGNLTRIADAGSAGGRVAMYNCSATTENYRLWIESTEGSIRDEITLVRSAGASDGATSISWKMVSNTTCSYPGAPLYSDEIVFWSNLTSSLVIDIHILHDSATNLKDNEVWIEASYLSASGTPLGALITDCKADFCATAADQDASTVTWTTTGMANPNKQKLSVTLVPQMKGFVLLRVCLAKASKTIYVCPKVEVAGLVNKAQYQIHGSLNNRFASGSFINIMNYTRQEQIPGNNFIIESTSSSPLIRDLANYFMAC